MYLCILERGNITLTENLVLGMENIEKEYYGNKVLKGIDIKLGPGEIHAIVGEN